MIPLIKADGRFRPGMASPCGDDVDHRHQHERDEYRRAADVLGALRERVVLEGSHSGLMPAIFTTAP
ncbi:MAG TPA: hypothetical protein VGA25_10075, partial [Burkholderiales bacterium]